MNTFKIKIGKVVAEFQLQMFETGWNLKTFTKELNFNEDGFVAEGYYKNGSLQLLHLETEFYFFKSEIKNKLSKIKQAD